MKPRELKHTYIGVEPPLNTGLSIADEFLHLAEEIKKHLEAKKIGKCNITLTQGALRTCISRAYYAAFLYARHITSLESQTNLHT